MKSYVEEHMRESLKGHCLQPHADLERLKAWYLKRPGEGRMMSCLILSTVEGLVILGDLTPCQNGVISALGYDYRWFAGRLSEDYLCSKFLSMEFVPEYAIAQLLRYVDEALSEAEELENGFTEDRAVEARKKINRYADELSAERAYDLYYEIFKAHRDDPLGYGYNPGDAGWLCAIQQRFSQLYGDCPEIAASALKAVA